MSCMVFVVGVQAGTDHALVGMHMRGLQWPPDENRAVLTAVRYCKDPMLALGEKPKHVVLLLGRK